MPASAPLDYLLCPQFIDKTHVYFGDVLLSLTMVYLICATQGYEPKVCLEMANKYLITNKSESS